VSAWEAAAWALLALAGLAGSAMASGLEMGVYSLGRLSLETRSLAGERAARLLGAELAKPDRLLATLLLHNNVCNYVGVLGVSALLTASGAGPLAVMAIQSVVVTPLLLIFAESLPKELFRAGADSLPYRFAALLRGHRLVYQWTGLVPLVRLAANAAAKVVGGEGLGGSADARQRMAMLLKEAGAQGHMDDAHAGLVDRALTLGTARVTDDMVPWSAAQRVRLGWDAARVRRTLGPHPGTTVPVIDAHGRVVGVASSIELLACGSTPEAQLAPPVEVEPTTPSVVALRRILAAQADLAVVRSGGRPVGVVTLRDLAAPLVGANNA